MIKNLFFSTLLIGFFVTSFGANSQSVSNSADNMFTDKKNNGAEELVEGIRDTFDEAENSINSAVEELEEKLEEESEAPLEESSINLDNNINNNDVESNDPMNNILILTLESGVVLIELKPEYAPNHVARIKELTKAGFYDGIVFHRVIDGFMAQTGDPTGTGRGGSGQNIDAEFNDMKHIRGTLSMARAADPNSADSQFFIMFDEAPHLDGNYTAFGQVIGGIENIDQIKKGFGPNGMVSEPDSIVSMKLASDVEKENLPESLKILISQRIAAEKDNSDAANDNGESFNQEAISN